MIDLDGLLEELLEEAADVTCRHNARSFRPGFDVLPVSGKVIGAHETFNALKAVTDGVLTAGPWTAKFEKGLAAYLGLRHARMVNSGSSANLLALTAMRYDDCREEGDLRPTLRPGDAVLTSMLAFPTTVNPIYQNELIPLFCDIELGTYVPSLQTILDVIENHDRNQPFAAYSARLAHLGMRAVAAVMMAHTLGNPWPVPEVKQARPHLWLIEDNCDALGSNWVGPIQEKTGTIGDVCTQSFYPAHHITTGEGGAVLTNSGRLARVVESLRDWGRDCWCEPGKQNTCGKRFEWEFPPLPAGTDHKYVYSRIGYNLKSTDIQAAIGVAQLERIDAFQSRRAMNFDILRVGLFDDSDVFILPEPSPLSVPSWFGFPLTIRPEAPITRKALIDWLWAQKIDSRPIFAGAIIEQPGYRRNDVPAYVKAAQADCPNARLVGRNGFWVGVWPGLDGHCMNYIRDALHEAAGLIREGRALPVDRGL